MNVQQAEPSQPVSARAYAAFVLLIAAYFGAAAVVFVVLREFNREYFQLRVEHIAPIFNALLFHGITAIVIATMYLISRRNARFAVRTAKLLLVLMPFLLLLSADRILNVVYPPALPKKGMYRPHETRGWALIPGTDTYLRSKIYIDQYGFRVPANQHGRELKDGPRILFLGDSLTFGFGLKAEKCFVERINQKIADSSPTTDIEVINAGVTGYDIGQELDYLKNECMAFGPDLVVHQICFNDVSKQFFSEKGMDGDRHFEFTQLQRKPHWSAIVRLVSDWAQRRRFGKDPEKAANEIENVLITELIEEPNSPKIEAAWKRSLKAASELIDFCKSRDLPYLIVIFPFRAQLLTANASDDPQQRILALANEKQVPSLDLYPLFREQCDHTPESVSKLIFDPTHPTKLGHQIAADAIYDKLISEKLIEAAVYHWREDYDGVEQ